MKVLLPIDGSDCSNQTIQWAAETFGKSTARYYLLFVIPVLPDLNTVEFDIVEASSLLRRAKTTLEEAGCTVERAEYVLGDTVDQICRYADMIDADQIVLGSHGRSGLAKLLMGSTSIKVLEHSHRPVTVHRNVEAQWFSTRPAMPPRHGITTNTAL
jgi:nucleotide-binding universal stress UspA family protein